jgi:hypothetical protein
LAEGEGFEPPLGLLLSLISSQVPSTTQPPFRSVRVVATNAGGHGQSGNGVCENPGARQVDLEIAQDGVRISVYCS